MRTTKIFETRRKGEIGGNKVAEIESTKFPVASNVSAVN
jgi:hypothetical protein